MVFSIGISTDLDLGNGIVGMIFEFIDTDSDIVSVFFVGLYSFNSNELSINKSSSGISSSVNLGIKSFKKSRIFALLFFFFFFYL